MAKRGRPTKFDEHKKEIVLAFIAAGGSQNMAAKRVGVDESTIRKAADSDPEFFRRLREAEAECYEHHVNVMNGAEDWRASAWMLERKFWKEFSEHRFNHNEETAYRVAGNSDEENAEEAKSILLRLAGARSEN